MKIIKNNLEDIIDSEELILIDGSTKFSSGVGWEMYEDHCYEELDCKLLNTATHETIELKEIFKYDSAKTIPEVTEETKKWEEIISQKIRYCERQIQSLDINDRRARKRNENIIKGREAIKKLQKETYSLFKILKDKEIIITDPKYKSLTEMIILIERAANLKIDSRYVHGQRDTDRTSESDTDEKLVSTLYYLSLYSDKKPALITKDKDFFSLIGVTSNLIGSDIFLPYNEEFRKALHKNPFNFWIKQPTTYKLAFNSSKAKYRKNFVIGCISKKESMNIAVKIRDLWKQFSES